MGCSRHFSLSQLVTTLARQQFLERLPRTVVAALAVLPVSALREEPALAVPQPLLLEPTRCKPLRRATA